MKTLILKFLLVFLMVLFINNSYYGQWIVKHQSSIIGSPLYNYKSVINNKVYLVSTPTGANYYVYEYDPVANSYIQKTISTMGLGSVSFTLNNKMFSVNVAASNNATRAYDPITDSWSTRDNSGSLLTILTNMYPPSNYGIILNASLFTFSLNNDAYIGGITMVDLSTNTQFITPYLFKYNYSSDNYTPITLNNMPTLYNIIEPTTFVINQKAYVAGTLSDPSTPSGTAGLFEIDLTTNNFTSKTFCTSCNEIRHASFVLNNKAYFNKRMDWVYCQPNVPVLIYDPATDNWTMGDSIMQTDTANVGLGFSVNNKGYFGYGTKWSGPSCQNTQPHTILYEYSLLTTEQEEEFNTSNHLNLYPNPSNGNFNLEFTKLKAPKIIITILDITGKEIYTKHITTTNNEYKTQINLKHITAGLYFANIRYNNNLIIKKIVIK